MVAVDPPAHEASAPAAAPAPALKRSASIDRIPEPDRSSSPPHRRGEPKRQRVPALHEVITEVMRKSSIEKFFLALEPLIRRVVDVPPFNLNPTPFILVAFPLAGGVKIGEEGFGDANRSLLDPCSSGIGTVLPLQKHETECSSVISSMTRTDHGSDTDDYMSFNQFDVVQDFLDHHYAKHSPGKDLYTLEFMRGERIVLLIGLKSDRWKGWVGGRRSGWRLQQSISPVCWAFLQCSDMFFYSGDLPS